MTDDVQGFWDARYAEREQVWSGKVNAVLGDIASNLPVGRALDLGCGEGGDVLWLAEHGWDAVGVDVSEVALQRGRAEAGRRGLSRVEFHCADLEVWRPTEPFDLVAASFFQSPVTLSRVDVLRSIANSVRVGGHLLVVTHGAFPPWADGHHDHEFLSPQEELAELQLSSGQWEEREVSVRQRDAVGPDGQHARLDDNVVFLRRVGA